MPDIPHSAASPVRTCPAELTNAPVQWFVRTYPAVSSSPAASTNARTTCARSAGVAAAVVGSRGAAAAGAAIGARPGQPGSSGATRTASRTRSTRAGTPASSTTVDDPVAVRPSRCRRNRTVVTSSATFWWITELANLVRARRLRSAAASTSASGAAAVASFDRDRRQPLLEAGGHARTPTRTLRNRAGVDGWPVWPTWPGWPLPQLGVPHATVSDESMSIEDQNRGPMPV